MNVNFSQVLAYLTIGAAGGFIGFKLKIPAGGLVGAMIAVIIFKFCSGVQWNLPRGYGIIVQVLVGVMIGATFQRSTLDTISQLLLPIVVSTLVLVFTGAVLCLIFTKMNLMDVSTGYLATNPGAMTVLAFLAFESNANPAVVITFHFVRVVFVTITAPLVYKLLLTLQHSSWRHIFG